MVGRRNRTKRSFSNSTTFLLRQLGSQQSDSGSSQREARERPVRGVRSKPHGLVAGGAGDNELRNAALL